MSYNGTHSHLFSFLQFFYFFIYLEKSRFQKNAGNWHFLISKKSFVWFRSKLHPEVFWMKFIQLNAENPIFPAQFTKNLLFWLGKCDIPLIFLFFLDWNHTIGFKSSKVNVSRIVSKFVLIITKAVYKKQQKQTKLAKMAVFKLHSIGGKIFKQNFNMFHQTTVPSFTEDCHCRKYDKKKSTLYFFWKPLVWVLRFVNRLF